MTTKVNLPPEAEVTNAVSVLRMLADRTRLTILAMVETSEMSVTAIAEALGRSTPCVSQHLAKLRAAGLVTSRREGTTIYYSQQDAHISALVRNVFFYAEHSLYAEPPHHARGAIGPDSLPHRTNRDPAAAISAA